MLNNNNRNLFTNTFAASHLEMHSSSATPSYKSRSEKPTNFFRVNFHDSFYPDGHGGLFCGTEQPALPVATVISILQLSDSNNHLVQIIVLNLFNIKKTKLELDVGNKF